MLTLWAAVVAERLGHDGDEALTLGKGVAGMNAYTKGVAIGVIEKRPPGERRAKPTTRAVTVELLGTPVRAVKTREGVRALAGSKPVTPESVARYLESKFGDALAPMRRAMAKLARSMPRATLVERARSLYDAFRPEIPKGQPGWGAKGTLDEATILGLIEKR